ncbi:unnamed protein product, partial [Trichobilharzia szidati]
LLGVPYEMQEKLNGLFIKYVPALIDFVFDGIIPTSLTRLLGANRAFTGADGGSVGGAGTNGEKSHEPTKLEESKQNFNPKSKQKLVLPLVKMNLIVQLCTILRSQLDVGCIPGKELDILEKQEAKTSLVLS